MGSFVKSAPPGRATWVLKSGNYVKIGMLNHPWDTMLQVWASLGSEKFAKFFFSFVQCSVRFDFWCFIHFLHFGIFFLNHSRSLLNTICASYCNSPTWNKPIWGWFPILNIRSLCCVRYPFSMPMVGSSRSQLLWTNSTRHCHFIDMWCISKFISS